MTAPNNISRNSKETKTCSWLPCHKVASSGDCSKCRGAQYCSVACQKKHWPFHKNIGCILESVPRHPVPQGASLSVLQSIVDRAQPGDVVELPSGTYCNSNQNSALRITKPINLTGPEGTGMQDVTLQCHLEVDIDNTSKKRHLIFRHLQIKGSVKVTGSTAGTITFYRVKVNFTSIGRGDAFEVGKECWSKKVWLLDCEVLGGLDGVVLYPAIEIHIQRSQIIGAQGRGIFANTPFTLENCLIDRCGAYGIKGRSGWTSKGSCSIQPGPWGSHGGAVTTSGGGMNQVMQGFPQY